MDKLASSSLSRHSPRHHKNPWLAFKRAVKNALFPIPGLRKFFIAARQKIDHALYDLQEPKAGPLFHPHVQPGKPRAIVISIPKSGTYLLHALLNELGLIAAGVHLGESGYYDQRNEEKTRSDFSEIKIDSPLKASVRRIGEGQMAAGHLLYLPENMETLQDFHIFFAYRESRAVFVSYMRYFAKPGHGDEFGIGWKEESDDKKRMELFLRLYAPATSIAHADISGWIHEKRALPVKFETLTGDEGEAAQTALVKKIAAHVDVALNDEAAKALLAKALSGGSRTWSGERSSLERYWSDAAERIFSNTGGSGLNRFLGYP
jgi:hypothetical protein